MKLSEALHGFILARSADGYSPRTIELYQWAFGLLIPFLQDSSVADIQPADLQRFFAHLNGDYRQRRNSGLGKPLTPASVQNVWVCIRSFYNWAEPELGIARADRAIKRPRFEPKEIVPFSEAEIKALLKATENKAEAKTQSRKTFAMRRHVAGRDQALLLLMLDTGLRVGEVGRLRIEHVNLETGEVTVEPFRSGRKTKGRMVYLGKATRRAVWRYLATREERPAGDPLFLSERGRPMDRNSIQIMLRRLGQRAKVTHVHPHRFRHTFAIQFLRNGGDVFSLQRLLGHSSLEMVRHYLALADTDTAAAHKSASPADRWRL